MQPIVLIITLLGILMVSAAFAYVTLNASKTDTQTYQQIAGTGYRIRFWWFIAISVVGIIVTLLTLMPFPVQSKGSTDLRVISAVGGQWYWKLDANTAHVGETVQFHVTTADVTHGFALYTPDKTIIGQTQAIPGFVSKLDVTFERAGKYRALCLEYCGVAHHAMIAEIIVTEKEKNE